MTIYYILTLSILAIHLFLVRVASFNGIKGASYTKILLYETISTIAMFSLIIIMGNSNYSDLTNYRYHFEDFTMEGMMTSRFEVGFNWLQIIFRYYLEVSFDTFKYAIFIACILTIVIAYRKITYDFSFFAFIFMLYEMFFNGIQMRNFIATSLMILGLSILFNNKIKTIISLLAYGGIIYAASLVHASSIAYLIFLLVRVEPSWIRRIKKSKVVKTIAFMTTLSLIGILIYGVRTGRIALVLESLSMRFMSDSLADRIASHSAASGRLSPIYLMILMGLYYFSIRTANRKNKNGEIYNYRIDMNINKISVHVTKFKVDNIFYTYVERVNLLSLSFIPLVFLSTTFYRILRGVCMLDIIYFACLFNNTTRKNNKFAIILYMLTLTSMWIFYDLIIPQRFFDHILGYLA